MFKLENVECIRHTLNTDGSIKAIKIRGGFLKHNHWIPFREVCDISSVLKTGDKGILIISLYFAYRQGWMKKGS